MALVANRHGLRVSELVGLRQDRTLLRFTFAGQGAVRQPHTESSGTSYRRFRSMQREKDPMPPNDRMAG